MKDWTKQIMADKHLIVIIIADMLAPLPCAVYSMLKKDTRFTSNGIAMLSHLLTHLNPSSSKNFLLAISDLTRLNMGLDETDINYMSGVRGVSQYLRVVLVEKIIPFIDIMSLDYDC